MVSLFTNHRLAHLHSVNVLETGLTRFTHFEERQSGELFLLSIIFLHEISQEFYIKEGL